MYEAGEGLKHEEFERSVGAVKKKVDKFQKILDRRLSNKTETESSPYQFTVSEYSSVLSMVLRLIKEAETTYVATLSKDSTTDLESLRRNIRKRIKEAFLPLTEVFTTTSHEVVSTDYLNNTYTSTETEIKAFGRLRVHEAVYQYLKLLEDIRKKKPTDPAVIQQAIQLQNSPLFRSEAVFSDFLVQRLNHYGLTEATLRSAEAKPDYDTTLTSPEVRKLHSLVKKYKGNKVFSDDQKSNLEAWEQIFKPRRARVSTEGEATALRVSRRVLDIFTTYYTESKKTSESSRGDVSDEMAEALLIAFREEIKESSPLLDRKRLEELIGILESVLWINDDPALKGWETAVITNKILYLEGLDSGGAPVTHEVTYPQFILALENKLRNSIPFSPEDERGLTEIDSYLRKNIVYAANGIVYEDRVFSEKLKSAKIRRLRAELSRVEKVLQVLQKKEIDRLAGVGFVRPDAHLNLSPDQIYKLLIENKKKIDQESSITIWTSFYHDYVHDMRVVKKIRNGLISELEVSNTRTNGMAGASNAFREMAGLIGALKSIPNEHESYWEAQYFAHNLEMRRLLYDVFLPHANSNSLTSDHTKYGEEEGFGWSPEVPEHFLTGTDPLLEGEESRDLKIVPNGAKTNNNEIEEYKVYKHAKAVRFGVDMMLLMMYEDTDENIVGSSSDPSFGEREGGEFASNKFNEDGSDKKHMLSIARSRIAEQFDLDDDDLDDVVSIVLQLSSIASIGTFTFAEHNVTGASPSGATRSSRLGPHVYEISFIRELYVAYKSESYVPCSAYREFPENWDWWHAREHRKDTYGHRTGKKRNERMRVIHHSHKNSRLARNTLSPLRESNYFPTRTLRLHDPHNKDAFREVEIFDFIYPHMYLFLFPDRHHRRKLKLAFRGYSEGLNNYSKFYEKANSRPPQPKKDGQGRINYNEYRLEIQHSVEDMLNTNISALKSNMMVDWLTIADMLVDYIDRCFIEYGFHSNPESDPGGAVELKRMMIGMVYECPGINTAGEIKVKDEFGNYLPHINPRKLKAMRRDFNTFELGVRRSNAVAGEKITREEKERIKAGVVFLKDEGTVAFADYVLASLLYESRIFKKNLQEERVKTKIAERPSRPGHYYGKNRRRSRAIYRVSTFGSKAFDRSVSKKIMGQPPADQKKIEEDDHK